MTSPALLTTLVGTRVQIEPATAASADDLIELDWERSLHPAMGGWYARPARPTPGTALIRELATDAVVGVFDAALVPGYPDVVSLSVYTDPRRGRAGSALEAYALYVTDLFDRGAHLIHHEVLELNRPIQRILRGIGVEATARLREHAYSAGTFWDVLVFSYDRSHWDHVLTKVAPRGPMVRDRLPPPVP